MLRILVTAILSIISYKMFMTIYLLVSDPEVLEYSSTSRLMREESALIHSYIAQKARVDLSDVFKGGEEFCLTGREIHPVDGLREEGIAYVENDFGFFGEIMWNSNLEHLAVVNRKKKTAKVFELRMFDYPDDLGGCYEKLILRWDAHNLYVVVDAESIEN